MVTVARALLRVEQTYLLTIDFCTNNLIRAAYLHIYTWKISVFKSMSFDIFIFLASGVAAFDLYSSLRR